MNNAGKVVAVIDYSGLVAEALIESAEYRNNNEIFEEDSREKIKPAYYFKKVTPDFLCGQADAFSEWLS